MSLRARAVAPLTSTAIALAACGSATAPLVKTPEYQPRDEAKCSIERSEAHPLIVEWPSADRLELENKVREGLVAVRYEGCHMRVLGRCDVAGGYRYLGATRSHDRVVITNDDDLYAKLPVGAGGLEGALARAGSLTVEMDMVGRYEAGRAVVSRGDLRGACDGATHFVYGVTVGAFSFFAGGDASGGASVGLGGVGVGGHSVSLRETLTNDGDRTACAKSSPTDTTPPAECGALIRIEVVPISADSSASTQVPPAPAATFPAAVAMPAPEPPPPPPTGPVRGGAMVHIPPGTFQMGSPVGVGAPNEEPLHAVTVSGFDLDATEVSVADYDRCVGAGVCLRADTSWGCNEGNAGRARHPINCVTRSQASAFCRWAGKRLPSEEEWEYAARGPEGRLYPWGGAMPTGQLCWHRSDGTCPVASFPRGDSSLGLHDMSGNVSEWTSSGWSDNYSQPRAQQTGVGRGGGWDSSDPSFVRTSARFRGVESQQSFSIGFRCAR